MLLLSALFQIKDMSVPAHAVVSSNVEAARLMNKSWACGMVNAVLRRALRNTVAPNDSADAFDYEHPTWLASLTAHDWPDQWREILSANNCHPPFSLRVNGLLGSRAQYLDALEEAGLSARATTHSDNGIVLAEPLSVERLPGFTAGKVSVQDEAAQLAVDLLILESDGPLKILDACAAPGGKTTHILERLGSRGEVLALDHDTARLQQVTDNLARLGLHCATRTADAGEPSLWWDGQLFDRILLDAPCSATGVIRRHPDIRFHRRSDDIARFAAEQVRLLTGLWPALREGGTLVYATCSFLHAENDDVIEQITTRVADVRVDTPALHWGRATRYGRQILPGEDDMDGFYYARLIKSET
jgi:16S rRNA (cytosine967-C5)-methyltransferase